MSCSTTIDGDGPLVGREPGADEAKKHQDSLGVRVQAVEDGGDDLVGRRGCDRREMWGWLPEKVSSRMMWTNSETGTASSSACGARRSSMIAAASSRWCCMCLRGRSAGRPCRSAVISSKMPRKRICRRVTTSETSGAQRLVGLDRAQVGEERLACRRPARGPPSIRSSLESKTRKIVPSATPAASAICLLVTARRARAAAAGSRRRGRRAGRRRTGGGAWGHAGQSK